MILADTDVLIDALRGRRGARERVALEVQAGTLATTVVSAFELASGAKEGKELAKVEALLGALDTWPVDLPAAREASRIRLALERTGQPIGMADYLIAGIALSRGALLLTRNRAHFERVPGLKLATLPP